jgi:hypothetical protein
MKLSCVAPGNAVPQLRADVVPRVPGRSGRGGPAGWEAVFAAGLVPEAGHGRAAGLRGLPDTGL